MPLTNSGIYRLTFEYSLGSVNLKNVFHYNAVNAADGLDQEIADVFSTSLVPSIAAILHETVQIDLITVENLTTLDPIGTNIPTTSAGTIVGQVMPTFTAAPFRLNRATRETRNGQKRIGPMAEENVLANQFTTAYNVLTATVAVGFASPLPLVSTQANPVIVRRQSTPLPWTNVLFNNVNSVSNLDRVSTQVSRKAF